ncbi:MAG: contractile injection system protein, VgrG/Pvc8 family, partial [Pseudomonadota bacterium]
EALAKVRAAELACRKTQFRGESNAPHLCPGYRIAIKDHPDSSFNQDYFITAVTHEGTHPFAGFIHAEEELGYRNQFLALPATVTFAPERRTARPRHAGLEAAWIDGTFNDRRGELDDQGSYRLRLGSDLTGRPTGKATPPLRRTQMAGGKNSGINFPLANNSEVVVGYINADPNRPLILGALDNPVQPGVITDKSRTTNRIRTTAGTTLEMNDGLGNPGLGATTALALGQATTNPDSQVIDIPSGEITTDETYLRIYVTESENKDEVSYYRLGSYDEVTEGEKIRTYFPDVSDGAQSGIFTSTDGARITIVHGSDYSAIDGNQVNTVIGSGGAPNETITIGTATTKASQYVTVTGDQTTDIKGNSTTAVTGDMTVTYHMDAAVKIKGTEDVHVNTNDYHTYKSRERKHFEGKKTSVTILASHKTILGAEYSFLYNQSYSFALGRKYGFTGLRQEVTGFYIAWTALGSEHWLWKSEDQLFKVDLEKYKALTKIMNTVMIPARLMAGTLIVPP